VTHVALHTANVQRRGTGAPAQEVLLNSKHFLCVTRLSWVFSLDIGAIVGIRLKKNNHNIAPEKLIS
jgi:hypothetical protein